YARRAAKGRPGQGGSRSSRSWPAIGRRRIKHELYTVTSALLSSQQLVESDRKVPDAPAGRVIDRVRDGGADADNADLAQALGAEGIDDLVVLIDEDHVDVMHVRVHREVIVREIVSHEAADGVVEHAFFLECHADTPDDRPDDLAASGLGTQDAAAGNRANDPSDRHRAELFVNPDFREDGRVAIECVLFMTLRRLGACLLFDRGNSVTAHDI